MNAAQETSPLAFTLALVDGDGHIRYQSTAIERLLGYAPEEFSGSAWFSFLHAEDAATVRPQFHNLVAENARQARWVIRFRAAGGGWLPVEVRARNLIADPEVGGVLLSLRQVPL